MYTKWGNDILYTLLDYCLIVLIHLSQAWYPTNVQDIFIQAGKQALKLKGIQFCKTQIARGLQYFKRAVANDSTLLKELQDYEDYRTIEEDNDMDEEEYMAEQMLSFGAVQHETDLETEQSEPDFDCVTGTCIGTFEKYRVTDAVPDA